jgi:hypothetical protein
MTKERWGGSEETRLRPIINPQAIRHVHIDPSIRGDATGFVMAHIAGWKDVVRRADDGREYPEQAPIYYVDVMLRIVPPIGGEIILGDVRRMIYDLSAHGYSISFVSLDSYQSADSLQQLASKGYKTQMVSVDKQMAPYDNLKAALYEDRVYYYDYPIILKELRELEKDEVKKKIDHPVRGSKDVADGLAGCLFTLSRHRVSLPVPMQRGLTQNDDAWMEEQQHAALAGQEAAAMNRTVHDYGMLPAFLGGSDPDPGGSWNGGWNPSSL